MEHKELHTLSSAIQTIKGAILQSRYRAAALANREQLSLYYGIGKYISENTRVGFWGTGALDTIAAQLQQELPGLRGFSQVNLKRMRLFYEAWHLHIIPPTSTQDINRPLITDDLHINLLNYASDVKVNPNDNLNREHFVSIGFTHHYELLSKTTTVEERLFYIEQCAKGFWSVEALRHHLKNDLYHKQAKLPNNFGTTIANADLRHKALLSFKDEYLLDYINIEDPDDEPDEKVLENGIVNNIKKFIMSLGQDFSFMGNQYRLIVEEQEYFIDLLFYNRRLQCLVAIELKKGVFKPEYLGKMNFYLSALDDMVRLPHENHSIGIILCKSHKKNTVEYAFRDMSKPMGVATFRTSLPEEYKGVLPDAESLQQLL